MSQVSPVSLGIINMSVTIGGVSPTRRRNRQAFSYVFNEHSIQLFNFKDKDKMEAIGDGDTGEFGISLKGMNPYKYHNWLAFMVSESSQQTPSPSSELQNNERTAWVNPGKIEFEEKLDKQLSFFSSDGSYTFNSLNSSVVEHFLFVPDGSLFRSGINNDTDALEEAEKSASDESMKAKMLSFYKKFVPYHKEVFIPGSHIGSGAVKSSCESNQAYASQIASMVDSNIPPDSKLRISSNISPEPCPQDEIVQNDEKISNEHNGMRHISVGNVFVDYVVEKDPRKWTTIRNNYKHPTARGNRFGRPISEKCNLIHNYTHPGIHSRYRKYAPIFRGMDFEILFKSMAKEAAVAKTQALDDDETNMLWAMRDNYSIIDSARSPSFSQISPSQLINLTENNAVFSFAKDAQKKLVVSNRSSSYYLADQPYVVIEIDGGKENRYFLIIPERGNVLFCEGTNDPEIIDYVDESIQGATQTQKIVQENVYHSRVLMDFGFSGKELLSRDSFAVRFQHLGGKLAISFGQDSKLHVISRSRWVNVGGRYAQFGNIAQIAINAPVCTNFSDWSDKYPNASNEMAALMLHGNLNVCFGNKKMAFIFSPIEYPESASLSPELPAGVLGLDGYRPAVNILLRSRGGPERPSSQQQTSDIGGVIANEDGPIIFSSPLTPLATRNISHNYIQQVNGTDNYFSYTDLPFDFRSVISADSAYSNQSSKIGVNSRWFFIGQPTEIVTNFTISNIKDIANHVTPMLMLKSGSMVLLSLNPEKAQTGAALILNNCMRPILKDFELFISEGGSASPMFQSDSIDVVGKVLKYSEQMVEQNKETIKHTASLDLVLSVDSASKVLELINRVRINDLPPGANSPAPDNNRAEASELLAGTSIGTKTATNEFLASLQDKYFYLRIRAHRSPDVLNSGTDYPGWFWGTKDNRPPDGINDVLFTGLCTRTAFTVEAKAVRMSCTLSDYSEMLENSLWIQPVFYDAMRDYNAVFDVLVQAGFYAGERDPMYDPAALVKRMAESNGKEEYYTLEYDGEEILVNDYVLPGSYDMINSPRFKASKFEPYINILNKMAKVSGKIVYFDRLGVMHFDVPEDELENMQKVNAGSGRSGLYEAPIYDKFAVTIKQKNNFNRTDASSPASTGTTPDPSVLIDTYNVDSVNDVNWWNVVTGVSYSFTRNTGDIKNEIRIYSTSPDMSIKKAAHLNKASMYDPTSPGFIGYRKMFVQKSGFYGSEEAVKKIASRYTTMMNPPVEATFSVPGRIGLRPLQTVILDGVGPGAFKLLLRQVSNEIDPKSNTWFSQITGRYLMPAEKIEFQKTNSYDLPGG